MLQELASFEKTRETVALLKVLALRQQDVEAGRAKWIEIDRQVPGARLAYQEHKGDGKNADALEKFCDDDPNAEECKVFDE